MATVKIQPTDEKKVPYTDEDETPATFIDEMHVSGTTAETLVAMGAPLEIDAGKTSASQVKTLLLEAMKKRDASNLRKLDVAYGAKQFLDNYGKDLAIDVAKTRAAVTTKLLEIANCGDTRYELKALELLGKHSDIGLFTERSEITIRHSDPESLEEAIKGRLKRILHAEVAPITASAIDLDEELGIAPYALRMKEEVEQAPEPGEDMDYA